MDKVLVCFPVKEMRQELWLLKEHHHNAILFHQHCLHTLNEKEIRFGLNKQKAAIKK